MLVSSIAFFAALATADPLSIGANDANMQYIGRFVDNSADQTKSFDMPGCEVTSFFCFCLTTRKASYLKVVYWRALFVYLTLRVYNLLLQLSVFSPPLLRSRICFFKMFVDQSNT
jgi:hypothetical protein